MTNHDRQRGECPPRLEAVDLARTRHTPRLTALHRPFNSRRLVDFPCGTPGQHCWPQRFAMLIEDGDVEAEDFATFGMLLALVKRMALSQAGE